MAHRPDYALLSALTLLAAVPARGMVPPASAVGVPPRSSVTTFSTASGDGLGLSLLSRYSARSTLASGTGRVSNPEAQRSQTWRSSLALDYRLHPRLTAIALLPHLYHYSASASVRQTTNALGDVAAIGKYVVFQDRPKGAKRQLALLMGLKLPTGSTSVRAAGERLPMPQQPGSGTIDFLAGAAAFLTLPAGTLYGDAVYKLNTKAAYTFGDSASVNLGFNYPVARIDPLSLTAEINGEFSARDRSLESGPGVLADGRVRDTGGELVFLSPGLQWRLPWRSALSLSVQIPAHQNLRGTQLRSGPVFNAGFYTRL